MVEHPDIQAIEKTGYPSRLPIRKVEIEISEKIVRDYIDDSKSDFIDWCFADPDIINRYLEETDGSLRTWVQESLAG